MAAPTVDASPTVGAQLPPLSVPPQPLVGGPAVAVEAPSESAVTAAGLTRRVRGAQLPDLGIAPLDTGGPREADEVRASLASLQSADINIELPDITATLEALQTVAQARARGK